MAYNLEDLTAMAIKAAEKENCLFITEIPAFLPCSVSTFYNLEMEKLEDLKNIIWKNRARANHKINQKWYDSDNATLSISLKKIIGSDEDRKRLSQSYHDVTTDGAKITRGSIDLTKLTKEELDLLEKINEKFDATATDDSGHTGPTLQN